MTNSGLIVFLPVVAAFVGAIIGAWANSWYRNREAKKAQDQEREGLLILLSIEVRQNNLAFEQFVDHPDVDDRTHVAAALRREVWDESRVRLAQLLPSNDIAFLAFYYMGIEFERLDWASPSEDPPADSLVEDARRASEHGVMAIMNAQRYISDPEFITTLMTAGGSGSLEDSKEADPT